MIFQEIDKKIKNRDYLKSLLEEDTVLFPEEIELNRKVRILTGDNIGQIGIITALNEDFLDIRIKNVNHLCSINKDLSF